MNTMSEAQSKFITNLLAQKNLTGTQFEGHTVAPATLTKAQASEAINALKALPNKETTVEYTTPLEDGVYVFDGTFYKVQTSPESGNQYAKAFDRENGEWHYEGKRPLAFIRPKHRATAEDAAQFGHLYGCCVFCARTLTDERSIFVGYGPTCAEKNGLPWGETPDVIPAVVIFDELACCDGTGWTGNERERCAEHYEVPGFSASGTIY
ncbi:MAG: DUF6011 domain-containing protein [Bacillota bacterium]